MARRKRKYPAAVALARRRMTKLSAEKRQEIAKKGGPSRFKGKTAEEMSAAMKRVRAGAKTK
jgi:hypothetical protein